MADGITFEDMERGRLLIRNGRAWVSMTPADIDRGARAVVRDCQYRAEVARDAMRHADAIGDLPLRAACDEAWGDLDRTPCVCRRTNEEATDER